MAAARERAARIIPTDIELTPLDAPQYVNENGYEVDAQTFALALQKAAKDSALPLDGGQSQTYVQTGSHGVDEPARIAEEEPAIEVGMPEGDAENAEPLLSLSESNVLHYSVVVARQHHLQHLLPHIFSHPPVPANARPRARPPPKGTFLYPTPPPLIHPLPHREYHAPTGKTKKSVDAGSPAPDGTEGGESKRRKYGRNKGKSRADESEAPAHEIECIARVTLSIGPISFPGTEIWVGRFVQPRAAAPKPPRAKKVPGEKKKVAEGSQATHARPPYSSPYSQSAYPGHSMRPPGGPSNTGYRPRPSMPPQQAAQQGQARPPSAPPRAELSPDLIKRVNEAATQHSWLSQIIHKAARSQATKEELAKLGRVVNRLKEGKDVGEGAEDGPPLETNQAGPSRPAARPPANASSAVSVASASRDNSEANRTEASRNSAESASLSPAPGDDSDDDSDVEMKGPEQVGGGGPGGVDPASQTPDPKSSLSTPMPPQQQPQASSPWISAHPSQHHTADPSQPTPHRPAQARDSSSFASPPPTAETSAESRGPGGSRPYQPHPDAYATYGIAPPSGANVTGPPPVTHGTVTPSTPYGMAPPPPRPTYHLPPPFLLVAFKEAPTEKFQLPLGSLSYISRVGEKEDFIDSRTPSVPPMPADSVPSAPAEVSTDSGSTIAARKPTRASLSKETIPMPLPAKAEAPLPEPAPAPDIAEKRIRSNLPLTGTSPPVGTVLISTFVPRSEWVKPDWEELATRLPFGNPFFERPTSTPKPSEVKVEPSPEPSASNLAASPAPRRADKSRSESEAPIKPDEFNDPLPVKGKLLNLATESFFPGDGDVHAVTIRLSDVTDHTWQRLKTINGMATTAEMKSLSEHSPHLMHPTETPPPAAGPVGSQSSSIPPRLPSFLPSPELRFEYTARKKTFFRRMLARVPTRKFLQYRLPEYRPDIVEATTDKWGPRPYPISTKALYNRDGDYDGQPITLSPVAPRRGNKRVAEPDVTFELPVSLDQLDEMVAENALKGKKGKGMDGRKRTGKRWVAGTVCEGCGRGDKRVWRSGPGGTRTLCNSCGDKFTANELGPLVAPGAAHPNKDTTGQDPAKGEEMAMTDKPVLSADAPNVEGETKSVNPTSTDTDPEPASRAPDTSTGSPTPLPAQPSTIPVGLTPTPKDTVPVASDDAQPLADPQAAIPISGNTDRQDLRTPPIVPATPMDLDHPDHGPSTHETETS